MSGKKPQRNYLQPVLVRFGTIRTLTSGGTMGVTEVNFGDPTMLFVRVDRDRP